MAPGGVEPPHADSKSAALSAELRGLGARVADGTRTRDHRDHNPGLYQLSYRHRVDPRIAAPFMRCPDARMATPGKSAQHFSRLNPGLYQLSYRHLARGEG